MEQTITTPSETQGNSGNGNWDALNTEVVAATQTEEKPIEAVETNKPADTLEINPEETTTEEKVVEGAKTEDKPLEATTEAKTEPSTETDELKLDVTDIKDVPKVYSEDTFQALAQELGFEAKEESFDAFKQSFSENFIPKTELEKQIASVKEDVFSSLKPEIAAGLKMVEMGIPQELALNPTANHDYLLSLEPADLLRQKYENMPNWDSDMVDAKMQEIVADGTVDTLAKIEKAALANEKQNILNTQSQLVQQYSEQKQQAEIKAKQESDQKFFETLNKESAFFGLPLSKEVKQVIESKYKKGSYDNVLNDAQNKVKAILHHEFGAKFQEVALSKAKAQGKAEIVQKLSDVPTKKDLGGARPAAEAETTKTNNWDALLG